MGFLIRGHRDTCRERYHLNEFQNELPVTVKIDIGLIFAKDKKPLNILINYQLITSENKNDTNFRMS